MKFLYKFLLSWTCIADLLKFNKEVYVYFPFYIHLGQLYNSIASQCMSESGVSSMEDDFFKKFYYLFIYFIFGYVGSSFLCKGFLQLRRAGATLHRGARASHYRGLSCCGAQAPDAQAQ